MINIYVEIKDRPSGNGQSVQVASNVYLYLEHFIFHPSVYFRKLLKYSRKDRILILHFAKTGPRQTKIQKKIKLTKNPGRS